MAEESQTIQPAVTQSSTEVAPNPQVLGNDPSARTATGEMKDQSTIQPTTTEKVDAPPATTPITDPAPYVFKAPDGKDLDAGTVEAATPIFRELGLNNDQAQKLVDFWNSRVGDASKLATETIAAQRAEWVSQVKADAEMGPKLEQIKVDVGRALDVVLSKDERAAFNQAMNFTGAGDNPAFIKAYWKMAQRINEGSHVSGSGPSANGQMPTGRPVRPTAAEAMYPKLSH